MSVEVAEVSLEDEEEWRKVISWVYSRRPPEPDQFELDPGESRFLARVDGQAAGACAVYDYTVARGASDLRCGGVAAVATLSEFRRRGVGDALMRSILSGMRDKGFALSALYAYRETYYRRFGYETCGWRFQIKCPQSRLPNIKSVLPIRQIDPKSVASLDDVYLPFIRSRSGSPLRSEQDWTNRLGKRTPMVYAIGEPMEAYLWVNLEDFWGEANIGEIAWRSRAGYETALSLISSICSNQSAAVWTEPPDSPFLASFLDQGVSVSTNRATMFRIVDVVAAFSALKAEGAGSFVIQVDDAECEWNDGVWSVDFDQQGVKVNRGGQAGLRTTIGRLSQAFMGQPSLRQLATEGSVEVVDPSALAAAESLLPPMPVVCMEFF